MFDLRLLPIALTTAIAASSFAVDERPDLGANAVVQSAADEIRSYASADIAFFGAGFVKEKFSKDDLATILQYPTDHVVVLNLTGAQIRQALERSVSLYPQPNQSFLQLSGVEVTFRKSGSPNSRIVSASVAGSDLVDGKTYSVAMPALLAKGGLGYFKVWESANTVKKFDATIESVLKGKRASEGAPRWTAQG
jgi:2',3'-cyclic-nucleotide 2'-phosphodiesterase (5'-nucleotidase family)